MSDSNDAAMAAIAGMMAANAYQQGLLLQAPTGADGKPVRLGETVYGGDGRAWEVKGIGDDPYSVVGKCGRDYRELKPEWLTHEKPDTWRDLYLDARNGELTWHAFRDRAEKLAERG